MISEFAVREFLARDNLRDSAKAKRFTAAAIDAKLVAAGATFHTMPRHHQKVCFLLGLKRKQYLFLLDMGLGKTKIVLDLFSHVKPGRLIVFVPNAANIQSWLREIKTHAPHLHAVGVTGGKEQRQEAMDTEADVVICTYMGWLRFVCDWVDVPRKKKRKLVVNRKKAMALCSSFGMVAHDECSFLGNHNSTTSKAIKPFLKTTDYRYGLTGTPFGRDPMVLWNQFHLIDAGETLGETLGMFRSAFFHAKRGWFGGMEYKFDKRKEKLLHRILRNRSIRYGAEECLDMPAKQYLRRPVVWPEESFAYYEKLLDKLVGAAKDGEELDAKDRGHTYHRMRQLCSGYLSVAGAQDEKIEIRFKDNPKLDDLVDALKYEIDPSRKVIVFHDYRITGQIISDRLKQEKIKHTRLWSGTSERERLTLEERFHDDAALRVLVSSTAGAYGLNVQCANYVWFFESPSSPILRKQMEARAWRQGQKHKVFIVDSYTKNSVESKILRYLAEGRDLFQAVVEGKVKGLFR